MLGSEMGRPDGSYRIYGIPPGRYLVMVQCGTPVFQPRPLSEGPDPPARSAYPVQYYPLANEPKSAQAVELMPGAEKSGVDFQLRPVPVTQIHGKLVEGSGDWHGRTDLQVQLMPLLGFQAEAAVMPGPLGFPNGQLNQKEGTFEFPRVFPGSYRLAVFSPPVFTPPGPDGTPHVSNDRVGGMIRVDIGEKPVEVSLAVNRAMELTGVIEMERSAGGATPVPQVSPFGVGGSGPLTPAQLNIQLVPANQFQTPGGPPGPLKVHEDGTFTITSVLPGEWRIQLIGPYSYVKAAWLGSENVTGRMLDLTSGAAPPLRILVSTNMGAIHGTAPMGAYVFCRRLDDEYFQGFNATYADAVGQFTFPNLSPGKYTVVLGELGAGMPEEGGQEVSVGEGETATVEIKG
jgi:hypothetical protein